MRGQLSESKRFDKKFGRREMLSFLGLAGVSGASTVAIGRTHDESKGSEDKSFRFFDTVTAMKRDRSIRIGDYVQTGGYHESGDGGNATYQVVLSADQVKVDEGEFIALYGGLLAKLVVVERVNYKMFGAKSDGNNDDGVQIKMAHIYANRMRIPVDNRRGEFWIKETNDVVVQTDVHWGETVFHIDERYNTDAPRFRIAGRQKSISVKLGEEDKKSILEGLKSKDATIPVLARYADSLAVIVDSNDRIAARHSGGPRSPRSKKEFFIIEEYGRVLGDRFLEFNNITSLIIYPAERSYLTVEGGTFLLSGHSSEVLESGYMRNGVQVLRSRTIIKNQWLGLEPGQRDTAMLARSGFYAFSTAYDLQLKNIRQIPYEKTRGTKETNVPQGTYGISCNTVMNIVFENVTADAHKIHWGVFGCNYVKNVWLKRCVLNRFDIHSFGWNVYLQDCHIGEKGITVTGGGELRVENSTSRGASFVFFRNDYGSRWDGSILIKNCIYYPANTSSNALLRYNNRDVDYRYEIGYARRISIENVVVEYPREPDKQAVFWVISFPELKSYAKSGRAFFPERIELRNISLRGRKRGMRIFKVPPPDSLVLPQPFLYDEVHLSCNTQIIIDGIHQLEANDQNERVSHISFEQPLKEMNANNLTPSLRISNCENIVLAMGGNSAAIIFENCMINWVQLHEQSTKYSGELTFVNCKFRPIPQTRSVLNLDATLGTSFTNCQLFLPQADDELTTQRSLSIYGFMEVNKRLAHHHLGTRLGRDVLAYLKNTGVSLTPEFINRLNAQHELHDGDDEIIGH